MHCNVEILRYCDLLICYVRSPNELNRTMIFILVRFGSGIELTKFFLFCSVRWANKMNKIEFNRSISSLGFDGARFKVRSIWYVRIFVKNERNPSEPKNVVLKCGLNGSWQNQQPSLDLVQIYFSTCLKLPSLTPPSFNMTLHSCCQQSVKGESFD